MFTTIPSSVGLWLGCLSRRVHAGGPDMLLRMMRATLTASDPMAAFERIGAAALPVPKAMSTMSAKHLVSGAADLKPQPHLRIVK